METLLQTYCFEIEVTCAQSSAKDAFVRRMAVHLVQYLAVFLAETITGLLQRVLTHPARGLVDLNFTPHVGRGMQAQDKVPILYLRLYSIRELDTVHIAHTCTARPFTGDLESKLSYQLPFAESARAVDGSFPVERGQMQPKEHHCIKLQHHIFIDQDHLLFIQGKNRRIPCDSVAFPSNASEEEGVGPAMPEMAVPPGLIGSAHHCRRS